MCYLKNSEKVEFNRETKSTSRHAPYNAAMEKINYFPSVHVPH